MEIIFIIGLLLVAYLYASVGHGGASGYLALMAFMGILPDVMKTSALVLNLFVSFIAFAVFLRSGFFRWKLLLPFVCASVPLSFIGSRLDISPELYRQILGVCLLLATLKMLVPQKDATQTSSPNLSISLITGASIGLISGMIGIGGGIILSPILILTKWASIKESACASAAFIFLNSAAGLFGIYTTHKLSLDPHIYGWIAAALVGGMAGSYFGANKISSNALRYFLSGVLVLASVKLLFH